MFGNKPIGVRALCLSASVLAYAAATPSFAQSVSSAARAPKDYEIIVTARKREESILNVPVIETAVTQKRLDTFAVQDLKALQVMVPAMSIGTSIGAYGNQVSIRGIGNTTLNTTVDQAISLNIDGLPMSQALAYSTGLFDVAQVEVLQGPQALFYGKSSTGGVISLRSNDPTSSPEIIGRFAYEPGARERQTELILSGPVAPNLKLRLASSYSTQLGYFRNIAVGNPAFGSATPASSDLPENELIFRGTALWEPTSQLSFRLKANYDRYKMDGNDFSQQFTSCPNGVQPFPGLPPFISPQDNCTASRDVHIVAFNRADFPGMTVPEEFYHQTQAFGSLEVNYHPSEHLTLTSLTGYYRLTNDDQFNGTNSGYSAPIFVFLSGFRLRNWSEEIRLNSSFDGPLNFTAGGFFFDGTNRQLVNGIYNQAYIPLSNFQRGYFTVGSRTYSLFGQVRYQIIPELELAAGARWTHETRSLDEFNQYPRFNPTFTQLIVPIGPIATGVPRISSDHINPEVTLTYRPLDTLTLFGSYKEASKSGGFQTSILQPAGTDLSFKDESVKGGEIGLKGRSPDRSLAYTLSAYIYDYSNLQVGENLTTADGIVVRTLNAASAKTRGVEATATYWTPSIPGLTLDGAVAYNNARFDSFLNAPCWGGQTVAQGCTLQPNPLLIDPATGLPENTAQNLSGRPLLHAPSWVVNFGFTYEMPVGHEMTLQLGSHTSYSSSYYVDLAERSDMLQKGYAKTDLSVTLRGPNDGWELALIGRNLADKLTASYCSNTQSRTGELAPGLQTTGGVSSGPVGPDEVACSIDRGREVWLRLTVRPFNM
jgi:outer membrane receptor protein involved in Fe transport